MASLIEFPNLDPWHDRVTAVRTEQDLTAVCEAIARAGIVLEDWPGLSKDVRAQRNRLKIASAMASRAAQNALILGGGTQ